MPLAGILARPDPLEQLPGRRLAHHRQGAPNLLLVMTNPAWRRSSVKPAHSLRFPIRPAIPVCAAPCINPAGVERITPQLLTIGGSLIYISLNEHRQLERTGNPRGPARNTLICFSGLRPRRKRVWRRRIASLLHPLHSLRLPWDDRWRSGLRLLGYRFLTPGWLRRLSGGLFLWFFQTRRRRCGGLLHRM
jgi:hypothetical protein